MENQISDHEMESHLNRNMVVAGFLAMMLLLVIIILAVMVNRNKNYTEEGNYSNINLPQEIEEYNYEYDTVNERGY